MQHNNLVYALPFPLTHFLANKFFIFGIVRESASPYGKKVLLPHGRGAVQLSVFIHKCAQLVQLAMDEKFSVSHSSEQLCANINQSSSSDCSLSLKKQQLSLNGHADIPCNGSSVGLHVHVYYQQYQPLSNAKAIRICSMEGCKYGFHHGSSSHSPGL